MSSPVTDIFPPSHKGAGKVRLQYVKTIADVENVDLAEINAATSFDATPYFQAEALQINHDQPLEDDTRLSDAIARNVLGRSTFSLADALAYVYNPQSKEPDEPGNLAYTRFVPNEDGFFVLRFDKDSDADFEADDLVDVYAVTFGDQHKPIPVGDNAKFVIQQQITLAREAEGVAIVDGSAG